MKYVLLLRGINVGGKNKVAMSDLKDMISKLGYENVITYINSGNIIFDTNDNKEIVRVKISHMLETFPFSINKVILTQEEYLDEISNLPEWWSEELFRRDVLFYSDEVDYSVMKERIKMMPLNDEMVHFGKRAVFWGKCNEKNYLSTSYHKLLMKESFYKSITIRNAKTFEKIIELLTK
ncbi:DUF1697 domain-containing protein [Gemella morbillorum]|jgi:hypothetical protein|uniref:DUF1697 domain-containing protein n=1 Tax=Gemella morbillorum TaxID=29391 RepID=UPI001CB047EE|nr:DUF1697 domain-containing protein [Gemella morbillorum]MBF1213000.1 DUF1697 domain-containing protein [Gemella morbillorum]